MFVAFVCLAELFLLITIILAGIWTSEYMGGANWPSTDYRFNLHPVLMVLGLVVFYGNAIMTYRVLRSTPKMLAKIVHAVLHALALICASIGLAAVWEIKAMYGEDHCMSMHSWIGITVVALFVAQWVFGLVTFLFPGLPQSIREVVMPYHVYFGIVIFAGACGNVLLGIQNYMSYTKFTPEVYLVNFMGICVLVGAALVTFIVTHAAWQRPSDESEGEHHPLVASGGD